MYQIFHMLHMIMICFVYRKCKNHIDKHLLLKLEIKRKETYIVSIKLPARVFFLSFLFLFFLNKYIIYKFGST